MQHHGSGPQCHCRLDKYTSLEVSECSRSHKMMENLTNLCVLLLLNIYGWMVQDIEGVNLHLFPSLSNNLGMMICSVTN